MRHRHGRLGRHRRRRRHLRRGRRRRGPRRQRHHPGDVGGGGRRLEGGPVHGGGGAGPALPARAAAVGADLAVVAEAARGALVGLLLGLAGAKADHPGGRVLGAVLGLAAAGDAEGRLLGAAAGVDAPLGDDVDVAGLAVLLAVLGLIVVVRGRKRAAGEGAGGGGYNLRLLMKKRLSSQKGRLSLNFRQLDLHIHDLYALSHVLPRPGFPEPRVPDGAARVLAPLAHDVLHVVFRVVRAEQSILAVVEPWDAVGRPLRAAARLGARPDRGGLFSMEVHGGGGGRGGGRGVRNRRPRDGMTG